MSHVTTWSYGAAALGYLVFLLLLLTNRERSKQLKLLILVSLCGGLWATFISLASVSNELFYGDSLLLDGLRALLWLCFLSSVLYADRTMWQLFRRSTVLQLALLLMSVLLLLRVMPSLFEVVSPGAGFVPPLLTLLLLNCVVLVMLERVYRSVDPELKSAIKPLCLGLGIIYAIDFYLYAQASLLRAFDLTLWQYRGGVHFLVLPLFLLATKRTTRWSIRIFVSRGVVYHGSLLAIVGAYLSLMSLVGYYIKYMGGRWGSELQVGFILLALLMLLLIFLSDHVRIQTKVFITKHFFANKYEYRDEWLAVTTALAEIAPSTSPYEHALGVMLERLDCQAGAIYRCEGGELQPMATLRWQPEELPLHGLKQVLPFCQQRQWLVDLHEMRYRPERYPGLVMPLGLLRQQVWLLIPLFHQEQLVALMALGPSERLQQINWEDRDYIKTIAKQLAMFLVFHDASARLAEAKQFETFNQMSAFLVHDLKNTLAQLNMILVNAVRHKQNPEFIEDSLATLENVVERMQRTLDQLKRSKPQIHHQEQFDLYTALQQVVSDRAEQKPIPRLVNKEAITVDADRERLKNVVSHLVQNAQEATTAQGSVLLRLHLRPQEVEIEVSDDGVGMDASFIKERLFRPFDTTKGNAGMGIGAYEARQFVEQLGGRLAVDSTPGAGTRFSLVLPR